MRGQGYGPILKYMVQLISQCMTHLLQAEVRHHETHTQLQGLTEKMNRFEINHDSMLSPTLPPEELPSHVNNKPPVRSNLLPEATCRDENGEDPSNDVQDDSELFLSSDSFEAIEQQCSFTSQPCDKTIPQPMSSPTTPFKALTMTSIDEPVVIPSLGTSPSDWLLASIHSSQMNTASSPFRTGTMASPIALRDIDIHVPLGETTNYNEASTEHKGTRLQSNLFPSPPKPHQQSEATSHSNEVKTMSVIPSRTSPVSVLQVMDSPVASLPKATISDDKTPLRVTPSQAPKHPFKQVSYDARMGSYWRSMEL